MTEEEVIAIINNVANRLARRFRFGYHEIEDIKQEARLLALEGLDDYDGVRPLENFLWTHVKNRLCNFKRDKYERPGKPCENCDNYIDKDGIDRCRTYEDRQECDCFRNWMLRNSAKKNLMTPVDIHGIDINNHNTIHMIQNVSSDLHYKEMVTLIEKSLPLPLRGLFIRLQYGLRLNKTQKIKIQTAVRQILVDNGYND